MTVLRAGWMAFALLAALAPPAGFGQTQDEGERLLAKAEELSSSDPQRAAALLDQALALPQAGDPKFRLEALRQKCWALALFDTDAAMTLAEAGIAEATVGNNTVAAADLHVCRGYVHERRDQNDAALREYDFGVAEGARLDAGADEAVRKEARQVRAIALSLRGEMHHLSGDYARALQDLQDAYQLEVVLLRASRQRYILNSIANLYADGEVGEYEKAIEHYAQVLAASDAAKAPRESATAEFNLGQTLERVKRNDEALGHYRRALDLERKLGDSEAVAETLRVTGVLLARLDRHDEALPKLDEALGLYQANGSTEDVARVRLSRGIALRLQGRLDDSLADLDAARRHFTDPRNVRFLVRIEQERADALAAAARWRESYDARSVQVEFEHALDEQLKARSTARLRVQFDTERKEEENRALQRENQLRAQALRDADRIRVLQNVVIGLALVVVAGLAWLAVRFIAHARALRAMSETDELTGLPNRRHVQALGAKAMNDSRAGGAFSVLALGMARGRSCTARDGEHRRGPARAGRREPGGAYRARGCGAVSRQAGRAQSRRAGGNWRGGIARGECPA